MKWSIPIGRLFGIPVFVHLTFLLILVWIGVSSWNQEPTIDSVVSGILFILAVFACVLLHEAGHALAARRYGIATKDITLLPIGGLARLERMPEEPRHELVVAAAGPAVNVVIALGLGLYLAASGAFARLALEEATTAPFALRLFLVNLILVVFNLLPAFPMDGGRVLRALLATRMGYPEATRTAANVGQGFALLFGVLGLFFNPFLLFIALFVWIGAEQEANVVQMKAAVSGVPLSRAMITDFDVLERSDNLARAIDLTLQGTQEHFPIVDHQGRVVGILEQGDLLGGLAQSGPAAPAVEHMKTEFETAQLEESLEAVLERLMSSACRVLPVLEGDRIAGMATLGNITELLAIEKALGRNLTE